MQPPTVQTLAAPITNPLHVDGSSLRVADTLAGHTDAVCTPAPHPDSASPVVGHRHLPGASLQTRSPLQLELLLQQVALKLPSPSFTH